MRDRRRRPRRAPDAASEPSHGRAGPPDLSRADPTRRCPRTRQRSEEEKGGRRRVGAWLVSFWSVVAAATALQADHRPTERRRGWCVSLNVVVNVYVGMIPIVPFASTLSRNASGTVA